MGRRVPRFSSFNFSETKVSDYVALATCEAAIGKIPFAFVQFGSEYHDVRK